MPRSMDGRSAACCAARSIKGNHVVADENVLAERAALTNRCAARDVHPVPDAGVIAYLGAFVDDGGWVDCIGHGVRDMC